MESLGAGSRANPVSWLLFLIIGCIYLFLALPSVLVFPMSFGGGDALSFPPQTFSLELYHQLFTSSLWMAAFRESLIVASSTALISTALGALAAFGLTRDEFPGKKVITLALLSPILLPTIVTSLGIYLYFSALGLIDTTTGLILAHSVLTVPYVIVTVSSGLRQLDPNVELAASVMGASPLQVFSRVVMTQVRGPLLSGGLFAFLISFDEVVIAWFITGTANTTLPVVMYSSLKVEVSPVIAAASTILSTATIVICAGAALARKSEKTDGS